jgi:hypothetical protein
MTSLKRILIAATLLITLVGGAGQASADTGLLPTPTPTAAPTGIVLDPFGVSWED